VHPFGRASAGLAAVPFQEVVEPLPVRVVHLREEQGHAVRPLAVHRGRRIRADDDRLARDRLEHVRLVGRGRPLVGRTSDRASLVIRGRKAGAVQLKPPALRSIVSISTASREDDRTLMR